MDDRIEPVGQGYYALLYLICKLVLAAHPTSYMDYLTYMHSVFEGS